MHGVGENKDSNEIIYCVDPIMNFTDIDKS